MSKTTDRYGKPTLHGRFVIDAVPQPLKDPTVNFGNYRGHKYDTVCPLCSTNMVSVEGEWVCPLNGKRTQYDDNFHNVATASDRRPCAVPV